MGRRSGGPAVTFSDRHPKTGSMQHVLTLAVFLVALAAIPQNALARDAAKAPLPAQFKLANGMDVIVVEDRRAPVVTHMVWYKAGSADEVAGKSGIAHFLEHLMFKGTKANPKGAIDRIIARAGGVHNAFTSLDVTVYHQQVPKAQLGLMMSLEADRLANLTLEEKDVLSERDVILEERNQSVDSQPDAILSEQVSAALYTNHRYGVPVLGWRHEMEGLTRADALDFYQRYYTPNNVILVVAGDVAAGEVKALAEKHYGALRPRPVPPRIRAAEPAPLTARRVSLADARVTQPQWSRSYLATSYRLAKAKAETVDEAHALDLFAQILGGGSSSLLYRSLVQDQKLAVSVSASSYAGSIDEGSFGISATPAPGVRLARLEAAIDLLIQKTLREGVAEADMVRAKTRFISDTIFGRDDQSTQAQAYGYGVASGLTLEDVADWPDRIRAITKDQVDAAARKYLTPERSVTALLEPAAAKQSAPEPSKGGR